MDFKSRTQSLHEEESPPPAYSDLRDSTLAPSESTPASQYYSSQIQNQISHLATHVSSVQTQRQLLSNAQDEKILSLLTNDIQIYLSDLAKSGLKKGTLILVPARALKDQNALPSDFGLTESDEFDRVVRVMDKESDNHRQAQTWYWCDEDMAYRLAGCLQPQANHKTMHLPSRKEEIKANIETGSSRGFWGRRKNNNKLTSPSQYESTGVKGTKISEASERNTEDSVDMNVKAEEVVFRTENAFGIWSTESGFAIVVRLKVNLAGKYMI